MSCSNKRAGVKERCGVKKLCTQCDIKYGAQYSSNMYNLDGLNDNERMLLFIYAATGDISEWFDKRITTRAGNERANRLTNEEFNLRDSEIRHYPSVLTGLRYGWEL